MLHHVPIPILILFTLVCSACGNVEGALPEQVGGAPRPPSSTPAPAYTEIWVDVGATWCPQRCLTLAEWSQLTDEPLILGALAIAYHHVPEWRPYAQRAAASGTTIEAAPLDSFGVYIGLRNHIIVAEELLGMSSSLLAPVLVHEIIHATVEQECHAEEATAFAWEALAWERLRTGQEPDSPILRHEEHMYAHWLEGVLERHVRNSPAYQEVCG